MGILIVCKGADFSKCAVDKVELPDEPTIPDEPVVPVSIADYPVQDTLKGLYDLGGTAEASVVNHAPTPHINTKTTELYGMVTVEEDYCAFTGNDNAARVLTYLRIPLENAVTAVVLFRVADGIRTILSNRTGGSTALAVGASLMNNCVVFSTNDAITQREFPAIGSDNFAILAMTVAPNGVRVVRYTNGALNELVNFEGVVDAWQTGSTGNAIQIGGNGKSNAYQDGDVSLAAIHEGVMTDEQLESICEFVRKYGKQKGLTVE